MNITYDKTLAPQFYDIIKDKIKNKNCPFCDKPCTKKNFGGALKFGDEMRFIHKNIVCLISYTHYRKGEMEFNGEKQES